jgi:hypothetical protein
MASIRFPPLVPPIGTPPGALEQVAAASPVALIAAEADALPFPLAAAATPGAAAPVEPGPDGAAMRPDQVFMSRQMNFPVADSVVLASSWRTMVRAYGSQLLQRDQQSRAGQLPAALLIATPDGRMQRQADSAATIYPDAWRFTVHARGPQEQHLSVVTGDPDQPPGRRRRARAALRLELELADGTRVTIQADPLPGGVVLELCAPDAASLAKLKELQPALELAVKRAGVRVLQWRYRDSLPAGQIHTRLPSADAAGMLSLPVFRALAEMALLLPGPPKEPPQA